MALQITGLQLPQISPEDPPSAFPTVSQPELSRHPSLDLSSRITASQPRVSPPGESPPPLSAPHLLGRQLLPKVWR